MDVGAAKRLATEWVAANQQRWPALRAAHLVGGITALADDAPFPQYKDVDVHLVVDDGSPALRAEGPFPPLVEDEYRGLLIEAGIKPLAEYRSAEAVLANPEIAHHLTLDCALYDPDGLLRDLQEPVRRDFARRRWVEARVASERAGLGGIVGMLPMARQLYGPSGEASLLGYSFTRVAAALADASLKPPSIGSRMVLRLREHLSEHGRPELYEEVLAILGVQDVTPARAEAFVAEGAALFDRAVPVRRAPHPFGHKMHAHLRPYFVESCRAMLDEGHHREACCWALAFHLAATDILLADGSEAEKSAAAEQQAAALRLMGMDTAEARSARWERATALHDTCFALAADIVARHPAVMD